MGLVRSPVLAAVHVVDGDRPVHQSHAEDARAPPTELDRRDARVGLDHPLGEFRVLDRPEADEPLGVVSNGRLGPVAHQQQVGVLVVEVEGRHAHAARQRALEGQQRLEGLLGLLVGVGLRGLELALELEELFRLLRAARTHLGVVLVLDELLLHDRLVEDLLDDFEVAQELGVADQLVSLPGTRRPK